MKNLGRLLTALALAAPLAIVGCERQRDRSGPGGPGGTTIPDQRGTPDQRGPEPAPHEPGLHEGDKSGSTTPGGPGGAGGIEEPEKKSQPPSDSSGSQERRESDKSSEESPR